MSYFVSLFNTLVLNKDNIRGLLLVSDGKLRRDLTFLQMIAIASGAVIGSWLAEAPYWFSVTGAGGAFVFPILAIFLIPVGLAFCRAYSNATLCFLSRCLDY